MAVLNIGAGGRQNVGRIDHVVYCYASRQSRDAARAEFEAKLGIHGWSEIGEIDQAGIDVIVDWGSGIELLCPVRDKNILSAGLAAHGEGFHGAVFGVADLDAAVERVRSNGAEPIIIPLPRSDRFEVSREAIIRPADIAGLAIVLGEFKPFAGRETIAIDDRGRMRPGAIDHLVFAFADETLLRAAVERFSALLGVGDWEDLGTIEPAGLRVLIAFDAGIEFICPARAGTFLDAHVAQHGPASFFAQVMATDDFDRGIERVVDAGGKAVERPVAPALLARHAGARHAGIGRVGGIQTTLSEIIARADAVAAE